MFTELQKEVHIDEPKRHVPWKIFHLNCKRTFIFVV